ncbi:hypothetical protein ACAW68_08590 [Weissella confusa]|uniref:hypothetical protein n=1 Tax=Weissella confusa TaxID=1583 RepID=UPI0035A35F05
MKFATIAATVLVASSVLATAGVVSADTTMDGKANVSVTNDGGKLEITQVPGVNYTDQNGKAVTNDLNFDSVTLADLVTGSKQTKAEMKESAFGVLNTLNADWNLTATVTKFSSETAGASAPFYGQLMINGVALTDNQSAPLYTSASAGNWNNESHTVWTSPLAKATMVVPTGTKVGSYKADVTYKLSTGTNSNTQSETTDAATQPVAGSNE